LGKIIKIDLDIQKISYQLTYASLFILALATFTSLSVSAGSHILILIPGLYFLKQGSDAKWPKSTWMLLGLFVAVVISVIFNLDIIDKPFKNIFKGKYFLFAILWMVSFRKLFINRITNKQIKILAWVLLIATSLASLSGLIGLFAGFNPLKMKPPCHPSRACGVYGMYMTYGYGISLFTILNLGLLIYKDKVKEYLPSWLIITSLIINFLGLYFSYARGGLLAFLIACPFFFFKNNIKKFFILLISGAILLGASIIFIPKLNTMFLKRGGSNDQRISFYKTAIKAFQERPIYGYGYRNFEPNVPKLKKKYNIAHPTYGGHAHNNFLEHLASTGLIGAIFLVLFHLFWFLEMFKRDDLLALLTLPFIVNFAFSGLFQYTFGDGENLFLILGVYALSMVKYRMVNPIQSQRVNNG
jgi:O-antigen ligase